MKKKLSIGHLISIAIIALVYIAVFVLEQIVPSTSIIFAVIKKSAIYALVAVSMNLLNGFTGLFSLGQAGFMLLGGYTFAILTIPVADRASVYQYFDGGVVQFQLPWLVAIVLAGAVAAVFAFLIGLPVLRLKSDYLAIATLGFAEIVRAFCQWDALGPVTNGSNLLRKFPAFTSPMFPMVAAGICIAIIVLLVNSSYGRAFKAIQADEIAAEAMGINLARHKMLAFCISSFFAGVGGALLAMYQGTIQASAFKSSMTYEILLIVVIGGLGSISGSIIASFLYIACSEWWLRFLDEDLILAGGSNRTLFIVVMLVIFLAALGMMIYRLVKPKRKSRIAYIAGCVVSAAMLGWTVFFAVSGQTKVPLVRNGFRMVVFSIIIMIIVLFFRQGIMGTKELPALFNRKPKAEKEAAK